MTPSGKVFDSSLDRGFPYDIRVGAGQVGKMPAQHCMGFTGMHFRLIAWKRSDAVGSWNKIVDEASSDMQIVAGLDEGIATMKVGGLRRLYIPGSLSFPKGLPSGPGR